MRPELGWPPEGGPEIPPGADPGTPPPPGRPRRQPRRRWPGRPAPPCRQWHTPHLYKSWLDSTPPPGGACVDPECAGHLHPSAGFQSAYSSSSSLIIHYYTAGACCLYEISTDGRQLLFARQE